MACRRSPNPQDFSYPPTMRGEVVDDYGGTKVPDPYRWLEDLDAPEVKDWVASQNRLTFGYLEALPMREHFRRRITELWNYPKVTIPVREGGRYFYQRNSGLQRQAPLFMRDTLDAEPKIVIDPNALSPDGSTSLAEWQPSPDGRLIVYGLSEGGADWQTLHVRDAETGRDLADVVEWMRFSDLSWTRDSRGFFYSRYPEPPRGKALEAALTDQALYYHRVGSPQAQDLLIYQRKDLRTWFVGGRVTEDGRYLLVTLARGSDNNNRLYSADLGDPMQPNLAAPIAPIVEDDDAEFNPVGNSGTVLYVRTDRGAPNRRVVAIDLSRAAAANWKTVVPERAEAIEDVELIGDLLVAHYLADVQSRIALFRPDGSPRGDLALPGTGSVAGISGRADAAEIFYAFTSPLFPTTVFRYNPARRTTTPFEAPNAPIQADRYETQALFATSRDGTRVPFFLTARKGLALDGSHPTMLYGYGGFSISMLPAYRPDVPAWLEQGGVWVTASLRGGAEYGEAWHKAGTLGRKQNVFDDVIAVAEHLVRTGYTSPARLGIMGGSNGGLLAAVAEEQRPDLFAVALPAAGVLDMLRYDRFTGGRAWVTEYGSASDPAQFAYLIEYSPVHNLQPGTCYPATLVTTADHDDRVVPSHSFKFAAALQRAQGCGRPVLIRVETQASHGYRPTDKRIAELADEWAFAAAQMQMSVPRTRD